MSSQTFIIAGASLAGAKAAEELRNQGFDGRVVLQQFNVVSILVSNSAQHPFDGKLRLRPSMGNGSPIGAPLEEPLFLSPQSSRWVQFFPYIGSYNPQWRLSWNNGRNSEDLGQPSEGPPALVLPGLPVAP